MSGREVVQTAHGIWVDQDAGGTAAALGLVPIYPEDEIISDGEGHGKHVPHLLAEVSDTDWNDERDRWLIDGDAIFLKKRDGAAFAKFLLAWMVIVVAWVISGWLGVAVLTGCFCIGWYWEEGI